MDDWKKKSREILSLYRDDVNADIYRKAKHYLDEILLHEEVSPELAYHCYLRIFPMIALYQALKTGDNLNAYEAVSHAFWKKQVLPGVVWMQRLMNIPGLYKLVPRLAAFSIKRRYKPSEGGFQYDFIEASRSALRLDIHQCPYYNKCLKYEVPELCDIFCTSDDIVAKSMLPRIIFTRTQTLGRGGICCDFSYVINPAFQRKKTR